MLTMSRIVSTPFLSYCVIADYHYTALVGCLVCGFTDFLDGYLARNYNMGTVLGTYLDPLADKILINTLAISLYTNGTLPAELVGLWMTKDVLLVGATYYQVASQTNHGLTVMDPLTTPLKVNPSLLSKLNTGLQFGTLAVGMVHPILMVDGLLESLCWITGSTTVASVLGYAGKNAFIASGNRIR